MRSAIAPLVRMLPFALAMASLLASHQASAQALAQEPLLSKTLAVRPNLTMILDESGSMDWQCIYKSNVQNSFTGTDVGAGLTRGCVAANDFRQLSPENNTLMYDPRKAYSTGAAANGAPNPPGNEGWGTLSDGANATFSNNNTRQGRRIALPRAGFVPANVSTSAALNNAANYDIYWVLDNSTFAFQPAGANRANAATTQNPFPKPTTRTDCVADTSAAPTCTYAEERQNIRNWSQYHRSRLDAAKVGVSQAFTGLPDSFRMNYTTLGEAARSVTGNNQTPLRAVNNYSNVVGNFRTWLNGLTTANSVGTPLRQVLDIVGKNYQNNTSNAGPWGNTPWAPGTEAAASHVSCRRSFAIMATDGQWNDGTAATAAIPFVNSGSDTDGTQGPLHTHQTNGSTYRYIPRNNQDVRNIGKADTLSGAGYNGTLADVALYYWSTDLRTLANNGSEGKQSDPPFWQNLTTYTVAFGVNGSYTPVQYDSARAGQIAWPRPVANSPTAIDDLVHAAHNGGGESISVTDANDFSVQLRKILLSIAGETGSQSGVAVSNATLLAGSQKYVPSYTTGEWWGNVSAIRLDATTAASGAAAWRVTQLDGNNRPTGVSTIPSPTTRNLWVQLDNTAKAIEFKHVNLTTNGLIGSSPDQLTSSFNSDMTDYIRGVRTKEGAGKPFRARDALLGDIVNSRPAYVKNLIDQQSSYARLPTAQGGGSAYTTYKATKAARTEGVLFVGANDGMLHAFRESDGREVFAFIPRSVLSKLHELTDKNYPLAHKYFVDGPMKESDAYIDAPNVTGTGVSKRWANLVVGTTGAGAKSVFALDVTRATAMQGRHVLWEISNRNADYPQLGHVLADVETGVTPSGDWIAAVGNGYDSQAGRASLYLVNLATGAKIRELTTNTATGNGLGGVRLVRNANSEVVGAYAGDLLGNVWRFDLTGTNSSSWQNGQLLFNAQTPTAPLRAQAITAAPGVFARNDGKPGYIVVVGTGRILTNADVDLTGAVDTQSAYGLWDQSDFGSTTPFSSITGRSLLVNSVSTLSTTGADQVKFYNVNVATPIDWTTQRGWVLDYKELLGQRSIYPIDPLYSVVRIDTIAPKANTAACTIDGEIRAINYLIDPYSGACKSSPTIDINGDNQVTSADGGSCVYSGLGDGTNAPLETGDRKVHIVGATDQRLIDPNHPNLCLNPTNSPCLCLPPGATPPPSCDPNNTGVLNRLGNTRQIFVRP